MASSALTVSRPDPAAVIELLKLTAFFAAIGALGRGLEFSGVISGDASWPLVLAGLLISGALMRGDNPVANVRRFTSRPMPRRWRFSIAVSWLPLSRALAAFSRPGPGTGAHDAPFRVRPRRGHRLGLWRKPTEVAFYVRGILVSAFAVRTMGVM